jgi:putative RNA 2'-phosphotransferase
VFQDKIIRLSKKLAYILRHNPEEFGITLDSEGYASLDEILKELGVTKSDVLEVIEKTEKRRFEIKENKIRALYGHSIPIDLKHHEIEPPDELYHGTERKTVPTILEEGLKPMGRNYVHLSKTKEDAMVVGLRRDTSPAILVIKAKEAWEAGVKFFDAGDVVLTEYIPAKYLKR